MKVQFIDLILFVLFFQLLTLVPFLFFQKTGKGASNKFLGMFLLAKAICITNFLAFRLYNHTYMYFPHLFYFGSSFTILWGPTLYLYIRSLTEKTFRLRYVDLLHALPFLLHFIFLTFEYHIYNADTKREIMLSGGIYSSEAWTLFYRVLHLYILGYTIGSFIRIKQYQKSMSASIPLRISINLSWMYFILFGFITKWMCDVCHHFADNNSIISSISLLTSRIVLFIFINIMIYKALRQPNLLLGEKYATKPRKQSLSARSIETYLQKLRDYMEKEKPYLDPELTFEQLSNLVSIPPRSLTTILNDCLNQNFYDFINSYRIKESVRMLLEKTPRYKTVLEVLYESGFNNKSSFNNAFKKYNGMTPTEFRKVQP